MTTEIESLRAEVERAKKDRNEWYGKWTEEQTKRVNLEAEVERLKAHATSEYQRGLDEGNTNQAALEIAGRERFLGDFKGRLKHLKRVEQAARKYQAEIESEDGAIEEAYRVLRAALAEGGA